ncbi:VCBS domain-containing protein [Vibrio jasicida]|uniref:VCBS domain-containing protein n=1 Tax=Vibrio jasicida TaxID=766224 RepID=UPI00406790E0
MKKIKDGKKANDKKQTVKDQAKSKSDTNKRRKVKLFSSLKIRVPLPSSLMLILPSLNVRASEALVSHAQNENVQPNETSSHEPHLENSDKLVESSSTQKNASLLREDKNLNEGGTEEVKALAPTPSHHLASHNHPIIHRLTNVTTQPSISNTIDSNTQTIKTPPTHTNPTTPQSQTYVEETIQGTYGQLHVDKNGNYQFTLAVKSPAYLLLQKQEPGTDTFTVHLTDGTKVIIQVPVMGKQDSPTITGQLSGHLEEDHNVDSHGFLTTSGKVDVLDPDHGESELTPETIHGQFGSLSINSQGYWQYTANNSQSTIQALTNNTSLTETFTIHTKDGTPQVLQMSIGGENDNALVSGNDKGQVYEDLSTHITGKLSIRDADTGEDHFSNTDIVGSLGTLHLTNSGQWTYDLDNTNPAVQALGKGSTVTDTITVHSVDGTPHQVIITINGTNDAAAVSSATVVVDETDKAVTTSGALTSTDIDNPNNTFTPDSITGTHGNLTIDTNGHWVFTANSAFNQLNVGDKVEETFTVTSIDGTPSTIKVTINGTNDTATVSSATVAVDETDSAITTSGTLTNTDVDNLDNTFTPDLITGTYGNLAIDANGHWVFTANSAFNQLNVGDKVEETFTVTSVDGTPSTIKVTINGTNDAATVSNATVSVDETESAITTSGILTSTDVDNPDNTFTPALITGSHGNLTIDANGHWVFTANSAFNQLNVGDKVEETFTVTSVDGTPSTIKVTINGTNDAATVSSATVAVDETDKAITTSGTLTSTDVDNPDNTFTPDTITGNHGDLTIDAHGHWVFTANSAFNQLNVGDKVEETFTVTSIDGTPSTIKVTINGTNNATTVSSATVAVDETDTAITTSGTLTSTDVDNPDNAFTPASIAGNHGNLTIDSNGHWVFTANSAFNQLNVGDKIDETFTVASVDGTQSTIKVTINGTNDHPTISGTSSGAVIEQGLNTAGKPDATGSLTATDLDKSDTITWAVNQPQGQWGTLSIDQNGHWHYQLDNSTGGAADKLAASEHQSESFWITATDSAGATVPHKIVIDVQGSNDKPIVSAWTQLPAGKEDQPVTIKASDLLTHASDVDSSDVLHVTNLQATHGSLTDNKDGTYTFTPDKDFNGEIRLTYDVVDGHGGSVSTQAKFDLTATPDNAIITDAQTNAELRGVTEDRGYIDTHYQLHYDGKLNIQDPDAGEAQFDPNIGPQTYQGIGYDTKLGGHILLMRDGHYTYTLDNRNIQNLAQGEVKHDSAVIRSADGTTHTIELTVHGTNDAPTINAQSHSVTEGGSILNGQMVGQDIDTGATLTYSAPLVDGLVVNPDGSYSFNPAHSSYQSLESGITKTLTVPVTVTDEHNASSTQNLSITITGVNNSAVIGGVDTGNVTEGNAGQDMSPDYAQPGMAHLVRSTIDASGKLTITDTDTGEAKFDTHGLGFNYSGQYGDLLLRKDGTWFYHADTGQIRSTGGLASTRGTTIDQLGENQTLTDTITVYSKDGTSHDIVITIHGSNDRPYCASEVQLNSGKEDLAQTITATELLASTVDVDANDAGKLTIANLRADHGSIKDNHDGTYTFTPTKDYSGQVHFTYDVQDAHGGTTHTGANTTLAATPDKAIISEVTTGRVIEDGPHATHNNGTTTELANGQLQVIDPDSGEDKFQYSQFGETRIHDPFGGMLRIDSAGNWGYSVDNAALQHLAQGQVETVTYRVHSFDGTAYDLNIDVVGTNDTPTVTKVVLSNGTEDTNYQMQASQFGFTDVDTSDTLHSIAITDLPPAAQGKFVLDGHDITAGQNITASDIAKLQFVPAPNFNGDVQFKFKVNDGHADSQEATNTLHIDAVSDAAQFTGRDAGDVNEGHGYTAPDGSMSVGSVDDRSPDHTRGNIGKLWNDEIHTDGHLNIVDPDSSESHAQTGTYQGTHGHVILQSNGDWSYYASIGQDATGRKIDRLGQGESITDTVTVKSADGTTHDIHITIHGDNDRPYCSGEVQLNSGKEDLAQTITASELLANTIDVDTNDIGKLTITNLHADHGSILDNQDGTYTFTPTKDYNGQVHFTYDVQDAHGGVTATGATLQLAALSDAAQIIAAGVTLKEDHVLSGTTYLHSDGQFHVIDPDGPSESQFAMAPGQITSFYKGSLGGDLQINSNGNYFYNIYNSIVDQLKDGEHVTDRFTIKSVDGTTKEIEFVIQGTSDTPTIARSSLHHYTFEDGSVLHGKLYGLDPDKGDKQTLTYEALGSAAGFHLDPDGSYTFDPSNSAYQHGSLTYGNDLQIYVPVKVTDSEGLSSVHNMRFTIMPTNDAPIVTSSVFLSSGTEDHTVVLHSHELLAHASDVDDYDRLNVSNLNADHGSIADNHDGTFTFTPDSNYNGTVKFSYDVTDNHGASTHTSASMTLAAVEDKTEFIGANHGVATEDIGTVVYPHIMDATDWQALQITDADSPNTQVTIEFAGKQYTWVLGSDLDVTTPYGKFQFHTIASGPHQGEHSWSYIGDNNNVHVQELKHGESLTESIKLIATDGTEFPITVKVNGTEDGVVIDSKSELGHVVENAQTGASVSGNVAAHDVDLHDTVSWTQTPTSGINGKYGTFHLSADGQWHYEVDQGKATKLGEGDEYWEHFTVEAVSTDGSHVSKSVSVVVHGNNDAPTVSGEVTLPSGNEDTSIHITQAELIANTTDVDTNDRGWLHVQNLTADHGSLVSNSDGSFTFTPDPNYNGTVHFTYDVADRHGGIAHTGANTTLASVNDAAVFSGIDTGNITEDHNAHVSVQGNYSYMLEARGTLTATDTDIGESGFDFKTLMTASAHPEWAPYQSKLGGQLEIDQHGNWNYYIDNRKPEVQGLGTGETLTDTVTIHSKDGTPHVITITINGTNDAPILGVNQTSSTTGTLTETDVDVKDTHTFSVVSSAGQFGSLSVDPNTGDYVYTPNTSITGMSYNSATNTYHGVDVFEVKVSDGHTEDSKFITFDASGHVTMSPTGGLVISTTVPQQPTVTTTLPTLLMVNNVAPTNTVTLELASTSDSGSSNTDNLTNDTTPTITGHTDIPFSKVTIYDGSTPVGHAVSDASGQYSVAVSSLSEGDHNLSAKALAPSSVLPATSSLLSVHIDTQVHVGIQTDAITADNVINAQESNSSIDITGSVSGDYNTGDIVTLDVNGTQHTGSVDAKGHYSIAIPGSELIADADQKIEASIAVTDSAGNRTQATADVTYQVDTQASVPTITFESAGADNLYSKAEIARGQANTITATITPPGDAKIGEHLVVNGQDHVLDAHTLQHGLQIEVRPGSNVQATMTDEYGNTAGSQGFAASAIPEPIVVKPPSGSHQVSGTLGVPPLLPSLTPVPTAQSGWRIHLPNGQYVTSHHGQYGTLTIDPQTGHLHYQEQAQVHTGPHGSAAGIGQHEDKFEVALQGTNQDEVVAHVNVQILSHGPGHSGKLTIGTEVVDMTITPVAHASHPAPPPPPPVQHDEPEIASHEDFTFTVSEDTSLDLSQHAHQESDQKTDHHGAGAYLDALGIQPNASPTTGHDQPADMDIVLAQVDQQHAVDYDQAHLDMSDALEHHDPANNHNQDDEHHHHNDLDGLPDIDPNN